MSVRILKKMKATPHGFMFHVGRSTVIACKETPESDMFAWRGKGTEVFLEPT